MLTPVWRNFDRDLRPTKWDKKWKKEIKFIYILYKIPIFWKFSERFSNDSSLSRNHDYAPRIRESVRILYIIEYYKFALRPTKLIKSEKENWNKQVSLTYLPKLSERFSIDSSPSWHHDYAPRIRELRRFGTRGKREAIRATFELFKLTWLCYRNRE